MTRGLGRPRHAGALVMLAAFVVGALMAPSGGAAVPVTTGFGVPSADGSLGGPIVYRAGFRSGVTPMRVELLTRSLHDPVVEVRRADLVPAGEGAWDASLRDARHVSPNTTFRYWFRAIGPDGGVSLSETGTLTVEDRRFEWRSRSDGLVTLHWYQGDDAFAERALRIGSEAIERASALLGVARMPQVDFFVYATEDDLYAALGPGTRENVGGQANADTRTMFGLIGPGEVGSAWVDTLVSHELTHLVFAEAVGNPYHLPPRWLNEGLAVWLSQGYDAGDRATVSAAAADGRLIPLTGLGGLFPTQRARFSLAYAESASAVDFFISQHGEETLAALISSYAAGVTDDEAFGAAIGMTMAAFDDAWMASLGVERPAPLGPRPAPPGPEPAAWAVPPPA